MFVLLKITFRKKYINAHGVFQWFALMIVLASWRED
jgi:hypothetical protein